MYDRDSLKALHKKIVNDVKKIGLEPHRNEKYLLTLPDNTYGCEFCALRYWRKEDWKQMEKQFYNRSCLEVVVVDGKLFVGIWFGRDNKDRARLLPAQQQEIIQKQTDYQKKDDTYTYTWTDENGNPAPDGTDRITWMLWLNSKQHETVFRTELTSDDPDTIIKELQHLKEYLDILLQ